MHPYAKPSLRSITSWISACALLFSAGRAQAQTACGQNAGPDVIISRVISLSNYAVNDGIDAISLGIEAANVGQTPLNYFAGTNQHPVIGSGMFRLVNVDGSARFEMLGQSWLHHEFFPLEQNAVCSCTPGPASHLGIGCSTSSTAASQGTQSMYGPKWQVNAHTGAFTTPPSNPPFSGSVARRLQVHVADLAPSSDPDAPRYFAESLIIAPDDATNGNGENNASYRELSAFTSGAEWNFTILADTAREEPALRAWQDVDASVDIVEVLVANDGHFLLATQVTDLGDGRWHYEYALYNLNCDASAGSFALPVPPSVVVTNLAFHDVDYHDGDGIGGVDQSGADWTRTLTGTQLRFETESFAQDPNANALRWGTLYNFRFDANAPPTAGTITIGLFKQAGSVTAAAAVPADNVSTGLAYCFGDGLDPALTTPCPCGNVGAGHSGCANSQNADGALLAASGTTNPDTLVLTSSGELANTLSIFLQGNATISAGLTFGDGIRCAGGSLVRLGIHAASSGVTSYPQGGDLSISARSAAQGDPIAPGSTREYQTYYRDPDPAFCAAPPGNTWNVTNAVRVLW